MGRLILGVVVVIALALAFRFVPRGCGMGGGGNGGALQQGEAQVAPPRAVAPPTEQVLRVENTTVLVNGHPVAGVGPAVQAVSALQGQVVLEIPGAAAAATVAELRAALDASGVRYMIRTPAAP